MSKLNQKKIHLALVREETYNKSKKIKLEKIESFFNGPHPNDIEVGVVEIGYMRSLPKVGDSFICHYDKISDYGFRTSTITEIIDEHTFKTLNSIYKIIEGW